MGSITTPKPLSVVIVGGSLGGLLTGVALKQLGHTTTILERNPTPLLQNQGAGVVAGGDTTDWFDRYDRCRRPIAVDSQRRQYLDKEGRIVHKEDMVQKMTSWDLLYYLLRANYDGVESDYCTVPDSVASDGAARYEYGHTVTGLEEDGDGVKVHFRKADGSAGSVAADLVVGADGPSSTVRKIFHPEVERELVGYCALRGTVPEEEASPEAKEAFQERFTFFHAEGIQILAYLIPGKDGAVEPGRRLMNFVYYKNFPADSPEFRELMTDADGKVHRITLPPGKLRPEVWEKERRFAKANLAPQFAELICKTKYPFAQAITDVISPRNSFMNGKVILTGDALAGFRPHTVASTSQAAYDAMLLADMVAGKISRREWEKASMRFARLIQRRGVEMGDRSQFGREPLAKHIEDRNLASKPRQEEVYPEWTVPEWMGAR